MKNVLMLFSILMCCLLGHAQSLTPSSTTIESGSVVTITGVGESNASYFSAISIVTGVTVSYPPGYSSNWIFIEAAYEIENYNPVSQVPTSFKIKITNSHPDVDLNITFTINTNISSFPGNTLPNVPKSVTLTVKHKPTVYYNDAKSQVFYKNDCGAGFESDPITYSVPANKYSSSISKDDANAKAQNEINANGQNKANAEGICKQVYYNTQISASFKRNSCGAGYTGSFVLYTVTANKHKSLISQADADLKATNDLNSNGQSYANANGTCTEVRKRYRILLRPTSPCTSSDETLSFAWIRQDIDLNTIYQNNPSSQVFLYTSASDNTKIAPGNYKILYPIDSNLPENGYRVFILDIDGQIIGYNLCN